MSNELVVAEKASIPALSAGPFVVTPTGLKVVEDDVPYQVWEAYGYGLKRIEGCVQWVIGDWLNYGECKYGEVYTQALENDMGRIDALRDYKYVASAVKPAVRSANVPWQHHRTVAKYDENIQRYWLGQAEKNKWSYRELREAIKRPPSKEETKEGEYAFSWFKEPIVVDAKDGMQAVKVAVSALLHDGRDPGVAAYMLKMWRKDMKRMIENIDLALGVDDE